MTRHPVTDANRYGYGDWVGPTCILYSGFFRLPVRSYFVLVASFFFARVRVVGSSFFLCTDIPEWAVVSPVTGHVI